MPLRPTDHACLGRVRLVNCLEEQKLCGEQDLVYYCVVKQELRSGGKIRPKEKNKREDEKKKKGGGGGHTIPPARNNSPQTASIPMTINSGIAVMNRLAAPTAATMIPRPPVKLEYRVVVGEEPKTWSLIKVAARPTTTVAKMNCGYP